MFGLSSLFGKKQRHAASASARDYRSTHDRKSEYLSLLRGDFMHAIKAHDMVAAELLVNEIAAIQHMSYADFAYYCHQRLQNASMVQTVPQQLTLF